jgi:hypothetical protein
VIVDFDFGRWTLDFGLYLFSLCVSRLKDGVMGNKNRVDLILKIPILNKIVKSKEKGVSNV